jgi:uncharacterized membrane protein YoaK (UPF0700 family)
MTELQEPTREQRRKPAKDDRFLHTRNILNIIFMVGAICGVLLYFYSGHTLGTIVILAAMVFKIVECSLRFLH